MVFYNKSLSCNINLQKVSAYALINFFNKPKMNTVFVSMTHTRMNKGVRQHYSEQWFFLINSSLFCNYKVDTAAKEKTIGDII